MVNFIKETSGQTNILTIPRIYITLTGDIKSALFLSQCVYWSDKSNSGDGYFYKTHKEWQEELCLTRRDVDAARKKLTRVLTTKSKMARGQRTLHFMIDFEELSKWIIESLSTANESRSVPISQTEMYESARPLTETTSETTIKNIAGEENPPAIPIAKSEEQKPTAREKPKGNPELFDIAKALSDVTGLPLDLNKPRLFKEAKFLSRAGITSEKILKYYSPGGPWFRNDWRGQKGDKPNTRAIRETLRSWDNDEGDGKINAKERDFWVDGKNPYSEKEN